VATRVRGRSTQRLRSGRGGAVVLATACAAFGFVHVAIGSVKTTDPSQYFTNHVVLSEGGVKFTPASEKRAKIIVVFKIRNTTSIARNFVIAGYPSPFVSPGKSLNYSIEFEHVGSYPYTSGPKGKAKQFAGTFVVR
jgi:hypothetical protein